MYLYQRRSRFFRLGYLRQGNSYLFRQTITLNSNLTLYAVWQKQNQPVPTGTLTFYPGAEDVSGSMDPQTGLPEGESIVLPKCTFSRPGYYFVGWSTLPDYNEPSYQDRSPVYVFSKSTANLYAIWAKESEAVLISFDPNGGSGSLESFYVKSGWEFSIPFNDFTPPPEKEYYTCISYDTTPDGYSHYRAGGTGTFTEDTTLYAYWTPPSDPSLGGASEKYKGQVIVAKGVTIRDESEWKKDPAAYDLPYDDWWEGCGWYDTTQDGLDFCWAATASNVIHWWLDRNKEYVDKYYAQLGKTRPDFSYIRQPAANYWNSGIFKFFAKEWTINEGNFPDAGFNWYITGYESSSVQESAKGKGGIFEDVFQKTSTLTDSRRGGNLNRRNFNEFVVDACETGKLIAIGEWNAIGPHVFTVWGYEFDDEGYVCAIYYTDSNTARNMLRKAVIKYEENTYRPYIQGFMKDDNNEYGRVTITVLFFFGLGTEYWEEYFANHPGN